MIRRACRWILGRIVWRLFVDGMRRYYDDEAKLWAMTAQRNKKEGGE